MRTFEELARLPDRDLPVAEGALAIAREEYPELDPAAVLKRLDLFARQAGRGANLDALNEFFFGRLGFRGNEEDYYDPKNSYLNDVIERRTGIPITLATVYAEIGRRIGLPVEGVGFPGHFLARCGATLVDCFSGRTLARGECQKLLDKSYGGRMKLTSAMLRPSTPRETLLRMLNNLRGVYTARKEYGRALRFVEMSMALAPGAAEPLRDRGLLYIQLEEFGRAMADLERYLRESPDAADASQVREHLHLTRRLLSHLN